MKKKFIFESLHQESGETKCMSLDAFFMARGKTSEIMKVLFKIIECHFIFIHFRILEAILHFVEGDVFLHDFKHGNDVVRGQVPFLLSV